MLNSPSAMAKAVRAGSAAMRTTTFGVLQLLASLALTLLAGALMIRGAIYFNFQETLTLTFPIIPVLFPVFYKFLSSESGATRVLDAVPIPASKPPNFFRRHFSLDF